MAEFSITDSLPSYRRPDYAEIVVVRHGETPWNAEGRIQGQMDVKLNEVGKKQAAAVADRLSREPKISAIYSSDLQRAFETAQTIASRCGGLEVVKDIDLRDRHMGDLQGHIYHEIEKTNPISCKVLKSKNYEQEIPGGGESFVQFFERIKSAMLRIAKRHKGERIVVVTHGASIRTLYKCACTKERSAGVIHNTSVSVFHLCDEDRWTLKVWADVSHLSHNGFLQSGFGGTKTTS